MLTLEMEIRPMTKDAKSIRRTMVSRNAILALFAVLALSLGAAWCKSAAAQISTQITIGVPPPFVAQPMPAPRMGYVWAPGYCAVCAAENDRNRRRLRIARR
jgi:hypothetical protein